MISFGNTMCFKTNFKKAEHGLLLWSGAILLIYLSCYGTQLFFDFFLSDDYGTFASDHDPGQIKHSGRLIYYYSVLLMRDFFGLNSENLIVLRAISLFLQMSFFIVLFVYLSTTLKVRAPLFFAIAILMTLPQIQIFSVWLVTLPYWVTLNLILLSIILTDRLSQCEGWLRILSGIFSVITIVISLLVNQLLFFVAISLLLVSMLAKAVRNEPWLKSFLIYIAAVVLGLAVYLLTLTLAPDTIGYTGHRTDHVKNLIQGPLIDFFLEAFKGFPQLSFHVFNSVIDSKTSVIFWLLPLAISIYLVGSHLFLLNKEPTSRILVLFLVSTYIVYLLLCLYAVPLLNPFKGAYRMYFPATFLIWGVVTIGLTNLWQNATNGKPIRVITAGVFVVLCALALANASYSVLKGIILPMTKELAYVKGELQTKHTNNHSGVYLRMPQSKKPWLLVKDYPREGLFSARLATYKHWAPRGILRYSLHSRNIEGWEQLVLEHGHKASQPGFTIVDIRPLEASIE